MAILDALNQSVDGTIRQDTLVSIAQDNYGMSASESLRLHENAIHAGVLSRVPGNEWSQFKTPNPSFSTFMQYERDPTKFKERMRRQMEENSYLWRTS